MPARRGGSEITRENKGEDSTAKSEVRKTGALKNVIRALGFTKIGAIGKV